MARIIKNNLGNFLVVCLIFLMVFSWIFSGWPQIWQNPPFPPEIQEAQAAVALDVFSTDGLGTASTGATGNFSWTHTPSGTPKGVIVLVVQGTLSTDQVSSVTYGSLTLTRVARACDTAAEPGCVYAYFGGSSIPTGAQTVTVNVSAASGKRATAITLTATRDTQVVTYDATITANATNPTVTLNLGGRTSFVAEAVYSGLGTVGSITPFGGWTSRLENDFGNFVSGWYTYDTIGSANVSAGWTQATDDAAMVALAVAETVVAPTVTTQAASSVEATTATGNGNITDTGGQNATAWGVCYKTSTGCTTADSVAAGSGTGGTGAFTASMTGLTAGTTNYIKAYATNSAGTSYGSEVTILTKPAAPTGVAATDGTYTDKVTITWTKSTGATNYHVWRDAVDLGAAGDVATFDDTGAGAPSIIPGSAVASDGISTAQVDLSLSGASANNGTTHTYKVVASNATGNSADSATNTGYRGVGSLTYQWQRSAADSDADYSNIGGATTASYNDTGAPSDGSGRWYQCVLNATGATQQTSSADRGYRKVIVYSVSVEPTSVNYGGMTMGATKASITITATVGDAATKLNIKGADATYTEGGKCGDGVCTWTLDETPPIEPGTDIYVHAFTKNISLNTNGALGSDPASEWVALTKSEQLLVASVAAYATQDFKLDMRTPSTAGGETNLGSQYSTDVTVVATAP